MQILFFSIGIAGFVMFLFGIRMLIQKYRSKVIGELNKTENEINFEKEGLYSICVGGGYASNHGYFQVEITNNETELDTIEKQLKFKFYHNGGLATELYQFEIENPGIYKIEFKNIEDLAVKDSMLASIRLFQKKLPAEAIRIFVKETSSSTNFIIGLLMTVFGFNIAGWGIILAFNPHLFK